MAMSEKVTFIWLLQYLSYIRYCYYNTAVFRASIDAGQCWQLVLLWCTHYSLPLSTHFIIDCAKQDNWQLFLTFAQIYNYPPQQVGRYDEIFYLESVCVEFLHIIMYYSNICRNFPLRDIYLLLKEVLLDIKLQFIYM